MNINANCKNCNKGLVFHNRNSGQCAEGEPTLNQWKDCTFNAEFSKQDMKRIVQEAYQAGYEKGVNSPQDKTGPDSQTPQQTESLKSDTIDVPSLPETVVEPQTQHLSPPLTLSKTHDNSPSGSLKKGPKRLP